MMRRLRTPLALLAVGLMFAPLPPLEAQAWGPKGHRLVALVAKELLSDDAKATIKTIMGSDDLATFALYMDQQKTASRTTCQDPGTGTTTTSPSAPTGHLRDVL